MARTRSDRRTVTAAALVCVLAALAAAMTPPQRPLPPEQAEQARRRLFAAIQPVKLANCDFERFGENHDGGYLLCRNLLGGVRSAYSYGISGYDQWGCDVAARLGTTVHEYDCFDLTRPVCTRGSTVFHAECIGPSRAVEGGRTFDTLEAQIARNGDTGKHLVVKIDVEGAEWNSLLATPDEVLRRIDQLVIEFHAFEQPRFHALVWKLKQSFHVANLHWNNCGCSWGRPPLPSAEYEVLFVNKRIGIVDPAGTVVLPNPLDQPNRAGAPDCQVASRAATLADRGLEHPARARP